MSTLLFILCLHKSVYLVFNLDHVPVYCVLGGAWWVTVQVF
jgi:hypothetical protein